MEEQDIFLGWITDGKTIDVEPTSRQIAEYVHTHQIRPYSAAYKKFRSVCLKRLAKFPKEQVQQLAKTLLLNYDLRKLGFDLVYYHNFKWFTSRGQTDQQREDMDNL